MHKVHTMHARSRCAGREFANELRSLPGGDVWIVGDGRVMGTFLNAGEVNAIEMSVVPVAISRGIRMYIGSEAALHRFTS